MAYGQLPADGVGERKLTAGYLHRGVGLAASLADRLDHLGHAAPVARMVVAKAATVGVDREPPLAGNQRLLHGKSASLALGTEAEILQLHQHGDGKTVV